MTNLEQALALYQAGRYAEALPAFRLAIKDDPLEPRVWYHAAVTASELRDFDFAISLLGAYTRFVPDDGKAQLNLGHALFAKGRYAESFAAYERAAALRPNSVKALLALGHLSRMLGRPAEAAGHYACVLAIETDRPGDLRDRALVRLALGDHEAGWREFEHRLGLTPADPFGAHWRPTEPQRWDGRASPGRAVCLYNLRGHGDTILFCRYAARAAERAGGPVTLLVQPALHRLVAGLAGVARVVATPGELPPDTRYADMWSLPALLGADLLTRGDAVPYLRPAAPAAPRRAGGPLRVGLAWAGHPDTLHDPDRSVPAFAQLAPLFAVEGVAWLSLQVGARARDAEGFPVGGASPPPHDFADTARLMCDLDLVITVDTAVANLAGALGLRAWVLPPTYPEPRWGLEGDRTSWYPTLRLFRRRETGEWAGAVERVAAALRGRVAAGH
jgi:tetratricopeptide (TPR) repeat protein